ncbi:MAG: hypothetical protein LBT89_07815 [Planctomycetaceae bacterium]|nr:hypothetical protein [Planctomycetaceae bacterium]
MSADNENNTSNFDFNFDEFAASDDAPAADMPLPADTDGFPDSVSADNPFLNTDDEIVQPEESVIPAEVASDTEPELAKKPKPAKKEKTPKEKTPRDLHSNLCLTFAGCVIAVLLLQNVFAFFRGSGILQTLCFIGIFDIIGLCAVAVPVMFYRNKDELDVFKVMLGVSSMALFAGVLIMLTEFFRYGFVIKP